MATNNAINLAGPTPAFMYVSNADQNNVTGDGTLYDVIFPNKIYDTTNSFDGTSTFTAPVTGKYLFSYSYYFTGITVSMTNCGARCITTSAEYRSDQINFAPGQFVAGGGTYCLSYTFIAPMTVGDTAKCNIFFVGGTKVVCLAGTGSGVRAPMFSGYMLPSI